MNKEDLKNEKFVRVMFGNTSGANGFVFKENLERQKIKKQIANKKEEKEKPVEKIKQRVRSRGFGR